MHTPGASGTAASSVDASVITRDIDLTVDLTEPPAIQTFTASRTARSSEPRVAATRIVEDDNVKSPEPSDPRLPLAPGRVLRDRYVLTQIIGTGGMFTVFRARDLEATRATGRPAFVALKAPRPDCTDTAKAVARLKHEFSHARRLSHGGIVQVHELDCDGDIWFMTMELLEGETLAAILRRLGTSLPPHLTRRVLRGLGDALAYLHAGDLVHGDLNPANVFVQQGDRIKLIDFAASCRLGEQPPAAAATPAYASPQVLEGNGPQLADDIFSFGCIAYEVIAGSHPFDRKSASAAREEGLRPQAPPDLSNEQALALMSALSAEREARPVDVKALAKTLAPDPVRIRTYELEPDLEPPVAQPQDDKRWWIIAGVCIVALVISVAVTRLS